MARLPRFAVVSLFLYIFISLSLASLAPARAELLSAPAPPSGHQIFLAQTESDTSGACYQGQGRAFLLSWTTLWSEQNLQETTISGLALYITPREDRYGLLKAEDFRLALRPGSFPGLASPSSFADLAPNAVLVSDDGTTKTYALLFLFPQPLTLKRPTNALEQEASYHTFYVTCLNSPTVINKPPQYVLREKTKNYRVGFYRPYDDINQRLGASNSVAVNLLLFSPVAPIANKPPTSSPAPTPTPAPPKFHPLVLIHGLGGKPGDWKEGTTNYQTYLRALGYPDDYVHYYSYGYKNGAYNYQGDIREIAAGLEEDINRLSALHKAAGGDGRVDLLGYSLGGVVARQYLASHKTSHKVRKLITIGSPHKGSWVLGVDAALRGVPVAGKTAEDLVAEAILAWVNSYKIQKLDKDSPAAKQIYPDSEFLESSNGINRNVPQDAEYTTFYGDIHASVRRKLFHWTLEQKVSIGDGLILPESATGIPNVSPKKFAYSEDTVFNLKLNKTESGYAFNLELPSLSSVRALHTYLLDRDDLQKDLACGVLDSTSANICK